MLETAFLLLTNSVLLMLRVAPEGSFPRPLSKAEEEEALRRWSEGDIEARNLLIEHNLRLVSHIMKKYYTSPDEADDLVSIGTIGLIKGIDTYKSEKGTRLATYASRCIENAILSQMRLWWRTNLPRAEKNQNGVFWHRFPRTFTSFAPLRTAM